MVEANIDVNADQKYIEQWKIKRLIKKLEEARGNGTSFVSLYIPAKDNIEQHKKMLTQELAGSEAIKSKTTKTSVQSAQKSTIEKLKLYKNTPPNGLIVFCGVIFLEDGKTEKKITIDLIPYRPINVFCYRCQSSFETEPLRALLEDDEKFGFVVVDGNGVLFGTIQGNNKEILQKVPVQLPKKHGRRGQSAARFARLREEKRHAYTVKVCELATQHFIADNVPKIKGLVMAGSANCKYDVLQSDRFDKRLANIVLCTLDVSYGMEQGFNQAIDLAGDSLSNVKFMHEKKIIGAFFDQIALDTGMIVFGVDDTMKALEMSNLETIMVYENIEVTRYEIKNPVKDETKIYYLNPLQEQDPKYFKDKETGVDLEVVASEQLGDWLCLHFKELNVKLEFITDKSSDGFQFVKGFGGIGGNLRYPMQLDDIIGDAGGNYDDFDPDEDFI
jgi:peptide chain release factor subunit 1